MSDSMAGILLHQAGVMAELATDRVRLIAENNCLQARAERAEAELRAARPLIQAAMAEDSEPSFIEVQLRAHMNSGKLELFLRAALAYRESQGTKEG